MENILSYGPFFEIFKLGYFYVHGEPVYNFARIIDLEELIQHSKRIPDRLGGTPNTLGLFLPSKGKHRCILYGCVKLQNSVPSRVSFEPVASKGPRHRDVVNIRVITAYLLQISPGTHLSTSPQGRLNSWVGYALSAQAGIELGPANL